MKVPKKKIREINLELIDISAEVDRFEIDPEKIVELAGSISEVGLLQPILLRPMLDRYELVAGHRRYLAVQRLEAVKIEAIVTEMSDEEASIIRATENLSRENLSPFEEAVVFGNLIEKYGMDYEGIGKRFGYKPGTVRRRMDLLKMAAVVQQAVHKGEINMSVAEELWPINNEEDLNYYLRFAIESGCTRATARGWCNDWKSSQRRNRDTGEEVPRDPGVNEPRPIYIGCDLCSGPMELGKEINLRVCVACNATIKANM